VPAGGYVDLNFYFLGRRNDIDTGNFQSSMQVSAPGLGVQSINVFATIYLPEAEVTVEAFPTTKVGQTSPQQVVATLTNTGENYDVEIRGAPVIGGPAAIVSTTCEGSLAPGESCTITAVLTPVGWGSSTVGVVFYTDATDGIQVGNLQGWVPFEGAWGKLVVSGGGYTKNNDADYYGSFGNVAPGGSSSKQVTLTNDSEVELVITNAFVSYNGSPGQPNFVTTSISGATFPLTLAPHDSVTVTFNVTVGYHIGAGSDNWQYVFETDAETLQTVRLQTNLSINPMYFG
jgi:hypothetical protein